MDSFVAVGVVVAAVVVVVVVFAFALGVGGAKGLEVDRAAPTRNRCSDGDATATSGAIREEVVGLIGSSSSSSVAGEGFGFRCGSKGRRIHSKSGRTTRIRRQKEQEDWRRQSFRKAKRPTPAGGGDGLGCADSESSARRRTTSTR